MGSEKERKCVAFDERGEREPPRLFDPAQATRRGAFLVNLLYLVTWAAITAAGVWLLGRWLLPFALAFVTAAALQKPVRWLTGVTRAPRGFLSGALVVSVVLLVAGAAALLLWWLWSAAVGFFADEEAVARLAAALGDTVAAVQTWAEARAARLSPETQAALRAAFGRLMAGDGGLVAGWLNAAAGEVVNFAARRLPGALFGFFIWVVASVFLTMDYRRVTAFLRRQIPPHRQALAADVRALLGGTAAQLARAYGRLMLLTFGELLLGLWLLRVPRAPLWAALIAVVDILPVLGVGTVLIPWAAVELLGGQTRLGLCLLALYLIITLVRNAVEPHVVGERVGLPPLVSLLCLYGGLKVAGVAGMVFAPLAVTVLVQLQKRGHLPLWK